MTASYTLVLGTPTYSSWSLRPYTAMRAIGVPFERIFIALRQPETKTEIRKLSPSGKVPALRITEAGETQTLWDSLAICETLAERHPKAGLWPADAVLRAQARSVAAEMHSGFYDVRDQLDLAFGRTLPLPDLRDNTVKQIERIIALWRDALKRHGRDGGFLFGTFSIADCMYAPVVSRFSTYGVEVPADVKAYMERIWSLPAMQEWGQFAAADETAK